MKHYSCYFYIDILASTALGILCGAGIAWFFCNSVPRLAVVDMQALIAQHSQHLAKTNPNKARGKGVDKGPAKVSSHQIWQAGEQLKETLEAFAAKHHLILLAKGAVMGGDLPDYTTEIMEDAFPDYTSRLLAFIENKTAGQQSKSLKHEGFRFEGLPSKGQGPGGPDSQENQP